MNNRNIKEIDKTTDVISSLIHEYLYKKDYLKTLDIFQQELSEKIKSGQFYSFLDSNKNTYEINSLLNYFEEGNKHKFMLHWRRLIPNNLRLTEQKLFKLDFNIEIYFAIYPILKQSSNINDIITQKNLKKNMEEFKIYLEQNKSNQFKNPEILSYYALPYVPDPRKNSSYINLFRPEWIQCLKEQIQRCIDYYSPSFYAKYPILYDLTRGKKIMSLNNNISNNINKLKDLNNLKNINKVKEEKKIRDLLKENRIYREQNSKLRTKDNNNKKMYIDTQKTWCSLALDIISYSFDLIDIYNNITNNQKNNTIEEINNKLIKYQNFLMKNFDELEENYKNFDEINIINEKYFNCSDNLQYNYNNYNLISNIPICDYNLNNDKLINCDYYTNSNSKNNNYDITNTMNTISNNINNEPINYSNRKFKISEKNNDKKIMNYKILVKYDNYLINMEKLIEALNHNIFIEDIKLSHILQEIRYRIDYKENPELRELTLFEIFYYDLFGTLSNSSTIFKKLLSNENLNTEVMKIVNTLANFNKGKNYLLSKITLIDDIVQCMISEKNDTELRQNCLGAIQKFTLRIEPQNKLIELNVIHYLVDIFTYQSEILSNYTIEYGLALLMNLSLRKEGKEKFEAISDKILNIILKFLNYKNIQVLTCINGMLYSLLKKKKIRELAKLYGIEKKLNEIKEYNDEQLNKQIKYIIDELNNFTDDINDNNKEESFAEEDINEIDNLDLIYNEYPENRVYDEKYIEDHYKILSEFLIRDNEMNLSEKEKIKSFMNDNMNMTKGLLINNSNRSNNDSSFVKEENNVIKDEEEIINTNINNINDENNYNECNLGQNYYYNVINDNNNFDDIYEREDDGFAFKTKDRIKRTPAKPKNNFI